MEKGVEERGWGFSRPTCNFKDSIMRRIEQGGGSRGGVVQISY